MSDEESNAPEETPPAVPVPRPDIAAPEPRKRGRKPLPRDAAGNIIRDPAQVQAKLSKELGKRMPNPSVESDEAVGKAIAGAFGAVGLFAGPHWRLFPQEEQEYGKVFGPFVRLFGNEELAKLIMVLTALPVIVETVAPRIAIQRAIANGVIEKDKGRMHLLSMKGMIAAEKDLDIERQIAEARALQKEIVKNGAEIRQQQAAEEAKAEGIIDTEETGPAAG